MSEQWRPVVGYEGRYEVSDHGRVRSLYRTEPHILKQRLSNGYPAVALRTTGRRVEKPRLARVHCLVAAAFIGPRPAGYDVRHLDGTRTNNHASNLSYGTRSENAQDALRHGSNFAASKTHCRNGHPFDEANTRHVGGTRKCRACRAEIDAKAYQRRQAELAACPHGCCPDAVCDFTQDCGRHGAA